MDASLNYFFLFIRKKGVHLAGCFAQSEVKNQKLLYNNFFELLYSLNDPGVLISIDLT